MIEFYYKSEVPDNFTGVCKITDSGHIYHWKNGKYHNENGPAVIWKDGSKIWFINSLQHREDGPACEYIVSRSKEWYYKGDFYGKNDDFTVESWKEKVKYLKREEELEMFK